MIYDIDEEKINVNVFDEGDVLPQRISHGFLSPHQHNAKRYSGKHLNEVAHNNNDEKRKDTLDI